MVIKSLYIPPILELNLLFNLITQTFIVIFLNLNK